MPQDLNGRSVDGQFYLPWNSPKFLTALPFAPLQLPRAGQSSHRPFPVVRDPITIRRVLRSPNSFRIRLEVLPLSEPNPVQLTFLELVKGEHVPGPLSSPTMEIQVKSTMSNIFQVAGTSSELPGTTQMTLAHPMQLLHTLDGVARKTLESSFAVLSVLCELSLTSNSAVKKVWANLWVAVAFRYPGWRNAAAADRGTAPGARRDPLHLQRGSCGECFLERTAHRLHRAST
jgi:hypothetical protein